MKIWNRIFRGSCNEVSQWPITRPVSHWTWEVHIPRVWQEYLNQPLLFFFEETKLGIKLQPLPLMDGSFSLASLISVILFKALVGISEAIFIYENPSCSVPKYASTGSSSSNIFLLSFVIKPSSIFNSLFAFLLSLFLSLIHLFAPCQHLKLSLRLNFGIDRCLLEPKAARSST